MKCNFVNYFLLSSLALGILDLGFFTYSSVELYELHFLRHSIFCSSFYNYCIYSSFIFLLSILVILSFVCCLKNRPYIPMFLILANLGFNLGVGIDNFVNRNIFCDSNCRNHCPELANYGDNFTIFMITNLSVLSVIFLGSTIFLCIHF